MGVTMGKEDAMHRRLFDKEQEANQLKTEIAQLLAQLNTKTQLVELRTQEVAELTEDI